MALKVNLGAGSKPIKGYVNVDAAILPGIDVNADLDERWPFESGTVDRLEADNVFEHVHRPVHFMVEAHRVLRPGGLLHIRTPHVTSMDSWTDPTHVRHCTEDTWCFWLEGNPHYANNTAYGGVTFIKRWVKVERETGQIDVLLAKPTEGESQ